MKILVAEDERITRRSLQRQLEIWGHEVVAAEDGAAAWERYEKGDFDIVISDWDMPRLDGVELVARVRADADQRYVYVIMLTGRSETGDLVVGMEAGADDFLTKPFEKSELRVRLRAGERVIRLERTLAERNELLGTANDRMKRDLEAAARVQQSMLPDAVPDLPAVRCGWRYRPCDELAGDALNILPLDDRYLCSYVVDVSGHGVPAALLSVSVVRSLWLTDDASSVIVSDGDDGLGRFASPAAVATRLNRRFPFDANGHRFFTMIYSLLDMETGRLTYACAGHPGPVVLRHDGRVEPIEASSIMVGVIPEPAYADATLDLAPGDRVYFYSDGIIEQAAPDREQFGLERVCEVLRGARDESLAAGIDGLVERLTSWAQRESLDDDLSVLGLEWTG